MKDRLNRPKRMADMLDTIFAVSRHHFVDFFKIFLVMLGPIILLEAIILLAIGKPFFRDAASGSNVFDSWINTFLLEETITSSIKEEITSIFSGLLILIFTFFGNVAVLYIVDFLRKGKAYDLTEEIKRSFSKTGAIIGSSILIFIISFFAILFIIVAAVMLTFLFDAFSPFAGVFFVILSVIAMIVILVFLILRIIFYLARIAFGSSITESFSESWNMTKGRVLSLFGIFFVLYIVIGIIEEGIMFVVGLLLGNSVLYQFIFGLVLILTSVIMAVAYAVIYFDYVSRHDAADLKEMIEQYKQQ